MVMPLMRNARTFLLVWVWMTVFGGSACDSFVQPLATEVESPKANPAVDWASSATPDRPLIAGGTETDRVPSTVTQTLQPTGTPWPALTREDAVARVEALLQSNGGSQLPCWWTICPGQTRWEVAASYLSQFDPAILTRYVTRHGSYVAEVLVPVSDEVSPLEQLTQRYTVENGFVRIIDVPPGPGKYYSIDAVMASYGAPDDILVRTDLEAPQETYSFTEVLVYGGNGIAVAYNQLAYWRGSAIETCIGSNNPFRLVLWDAETDGDYLEILNRSTLTDKDLAYRSIQEATGVSASDLQTTMEQITSGGTSCLSSPTSLWR